MTPLVLTLLLLIPVEAFLVEELPTTNIFCFFLPNCNLFSLLEPSFPKQAVYISGYPGTWGLGEDCTVCWPDFTGCLGRLLWDYFGVMAISKPPGLRIFLFDAASLNS